MQKHYMKQFRMRATEANMRDALITFATKAIAIGCASFVLLAAIFPSTVSAASNSPHEEPQYKILSFQVLEPALEPRTGSGGGMWHGPDHRLKLSNATLRFLISRAFDVQDAQIVGLPEWADTSRFDITLQSDALLLGTLEGEYADRRRVQMLLADRFGLSFHWEEHEIEALALLVGEDGPRFKEYESKTNGWLGVGLLAGNLVGRGTPMIRVAEALSRELGRTVLDCTELEGRYDLYARWDSKTGKRFQWTYGASTHGPASASPEPASSIEEAMSVQLGLVLEFRKVPAAVVVVDHAEQPSGT